MKRRMKRSYQLIILLMGISLATTAQNSNTTYSLKQCVDYAMANSPLIKNSGIDVKMSQNKKGQLSSKALPQVDAGVDYVHNFNIQRIILENGVIPAFTNPNEPYGSVVAFQLQLQNQLTMSVSANQVLYDRSLYAGLKATNIGTELSQKSLEKTKIDLAEMVTKAYYGVLVSQKQLEFLNTNLTRLDSLYRETSVRYNSGIARKIDLDRIEVSLNNLKQEREKALKSVELSAAVLAYHMNYDGNTIALSDTLSEAMLSDLNESKSADYSARIEYSMLQTQRKLNDADLRSTKGEYTPRLYAFATSGYNPAATDASNLFQSSRYYNYTFVGVKLQVPLFHGSERRYKVGNKELEEQKLENNIKRTEKMISLEVQQSEINYIRNMETLKIQKRNLDLAQENVRVITAENKGGIATNLEVTNAETDLKEAQNNYYGALYQALITKTDMDKAKGKLSYQ